MKRAKCISSYPDFFEDGRTYRFLTFRQSDRIRVVNELGKKIEFPDRNTMQRSFEIVEDDPAEGSTVYLIAYEIHEQLYDYSALKTALMAYGDVMHPMESLWFICVPDDTTIGDIRHDLMEHLHDRDRIYIMQLQPGTLSSGWMQRAMWGWLKKRLKK